LTNTGIHNLSKDYNITGIPRFILVDPNGKLSKDAPRPSSPTIEAEFDGF
jgi:hypothetical protein